MYGSSVRNGCVGVGCMGDSFVGLVSYVIGAHVTGVL